MLTPLSILSLDQGPKWQEPVDAGAPAAPKAPEEAPGRASSLVEAFAARLLALRLRHLRPTA